MTDEQRPGGDEVEKSGGAPVREGTAPLPHEGQQGDGVSERRGDADQTGREVHEVEEPG